MANATGGDGGNATGNGILKGGAGERATAEAATGASGANCCSPPQQGGAGGAGGDAISHSGMPGSPNGVRNQNTGNGGNGGRGGDGNGPGTFGPGGFGDGDPIFIGPGSSGFSGNPCVVAQTALSKSNITGDTNGGAIRRSGAPLRSEIAPSAAGAVAYSSFGFTNGGANSFLRDTDTAGNLTASSDFSNVTIIGGQPTADGGLVLAGQQFAGAPSLQPWAARLDSANNILWQSYFSPEATGGGARAIEQTGDGGFILAANYSLVNKAQDFFILKLNANGGIVWERNYGGTMSEEPWTIHPTSDGGYIVSGCIASLACNTIQEDTWVLKLDALGNAVWSIRLNYATTVYIGEIQETADAGFIVAGAILDSGTGIDSWVAKLDAAGAVVWQNSYAGALDEFARSIQQTDDDNDGMKDDGFIFTGPTGSAGNNGDVLVTKLDPSGNIVWQKTYGGSGNEGGVTIRQTDDGGFIIGGGSSTETWVIKTDAGGNVYNCQAGYGIGVDVPAGTIVVSNTTVSPVNYAFTSGTPASTVGTGTSVSTLASPASSLICTG
ncbi:MAG: hypothetical protein ACREJQ_08705 [bacterium]